MVFNIPIKRCACAAAAKPRPPSPSRLKLIQSERCVTAVLSCLLCVSNIITPVAVTIVGSREQRACRKRARMGAESEQDRPRKGFSRSSTYIIILDSLTAEMSMQFTPSSLHKKRMSRPEQKQMKSLGRTRWLIQADNVRPPPCQAQS